VAEISRKDFDGAEAMHKLKNLSMVRSLHLLAAQAHGGR